nr:SDR family oxidoreductase [bacterium]
MIAGKVIAITGGAGVLCSGFARALAVEGAKVAILDRAVEPAKKLADEITAAGGKAIGVYIDVLNKEAIKAAADEVRAAFGPVDMLINGAGGNHPRATTTGETMSPEDVLGEEGKTTFFSLSKEDIGFVFDLNFLGTVLPTQEFARDMVGREGCCIVNVSSMNAFRPLTKIPAYSGAKAAISNFTQWLAVHMAPVGVRVNAIAPGFFVTQQNEKLLLNPDGSLTPRSEKILAATPMGRFGKPEEILGALMWLLDEEKASFITGVVVPIDGGFSAYSGV